MKKLFFMLIILFTLYLGVQVLFSFLGKGEHSSYIINNNNIRFEIDENSYFSSKINNYSYNIKTLGSSFKFQINYNFNRSSQVITEIEYFKSNKYECILPVFKNDLILMDMLCLNGKNYVYYRSIKGNDKTLDSYVSKLEKYDKSQFVDSTKSEKIEGLNVYKDNLVDNYYLTITNSKGIYDISSNFESIAYNISLLSKDAFNQSIRTYLDEYYIVADYNSKNGFKKFYVLNVMKLTDFTISSDSKISFNSYIQGVVDDKVYLYDIDNKVQYEIDIRNQRIIPYFGESIKYYNNGVWTTITTKEADSYKPFITQQFEYSDKGYARVDLVGNEVGYYYLYKKSNNGYDVYRKDINDNNTLTYLFTTKTIDNIYYIDNYVYFLNNNVIQVYNDEFGIRNIVQSNNFANNNDLSFRVYSK